MFYGSIVNVKDTPLAGAGTTLQRPTFGINGSLWINLDTPASPVWQRYRSSDATWVDIGSVDPTLPAWALAGNTVTDNLKQLGTIDNFDLRFITNNTERAKIAALGVFEIQRLSLGNNSQELGANNIFLSQGSGTNFFGGGGFYLTCATADNWFKVRRCVNFSVIAGGTFDTAEASAIAQFTSTTQGILDPRMTAAQFAAIAAPVAGLRAYDSTNNRFTLWDGTRVCQIPKVLNGSAALNFPSTAAGTSSDLTIAVTGAADGDVVSLGVPNASTVANGCFTAWCSAADTVTVRFTNNDLLVALDPASGTFKVTVFK